MVSISADQACNRSPSMKEEITGVLFTLSRNKLTLNSQCEEGANHDNVY